MKDTMPSRFDPTYYKRYVRRNSKKVKSILGSVGHFETMLDIGCNHGYVVKAFLDSGQVDIAEGVDMDVSVVDPELLENEKFSFFQGNVLGFKFEKEYDVIIFNSVLHHVFGTYGKNTAFDLWDRVVDHCERVLIFEIGVMTEVGHHYWKDEYRKYYFSDSQILTVLLNRVGSRLKNCEKIASLPIHMAGRPIYKIELFPIGSDNDLKAQENKYYGEYLSVEKTEWNVISKYHRTYGSRGQKLFSIEDINHNGSGELFNETAFFKLSDGSNNLFFGKQILNDPYKKMREFLLLRTISNPHIPRLLEVHPEYGFIFRYYDWKTLENVDFHKMQNLSEFVDEIRSFFDWLAKTTIAPGVLDLNPAERGTRRALIDIIDVHQNNFMVKIENDKIQDWVLVDLEYTFNNGEGRNRRTLNNILMRARNRSMMVYLLAIWYLVQDIYRGFIKKSRLIPYAVFSGLFMIYVLARSTYRLIIGKKI